MTTVEITRASLDAAERLIPPGRPVYMLNLWRYRAQARYEAGSNETPCSGRQALLERYIPAFRRLAAGRAITRLFSAAMLAPIVGPPGEAWDDMALNEYGDFATFRAIVDTEVYRREVAPHRHAALEDFRLYALDKTM
jgi:hypothetical protein